MPDVESKVQSHGFMDTKVIKLNSMQLYIKPCTFIKMVYHLKWYLMEIITKINALKDLKLFYFYKEIITSFNAYKRKDKINTYDFYQTNMV